MWVNLLLVAIMLVGCDCKKTKSRLCNDSENEYSRTFLQGKILMKHRYCKENDYCQKDCDK